MSISYDNLVNYAAGKLTAAEAEMVEAFIAKNQDAAATVRRYREFFDCVRADNSIEPPIATMNQARALFREHLSRVAKTSDNWLVKLERVVAQLIFDSRPQVALAGFRGGSTEYQLAYETPDAAIDFQVNPIAGETTQRELIGQISTTDEGAKIEAIVLSKPGAFEQVAATTVDEHGMFEFRVSEGTFDVLVAVNGTLVVVPNVEVR